VTVKFLRYLAENLSRSRKTILKYQQILSDFFTFVREEKHIDVENPVTKNIPRMGKIVDMSAAGVPESIRRILKNEIEKENPQLWMACCFVYYTAIRLGTELRFMKIKQINFDSRTITVLNGLAKNRRTETIDVPDELYVLMTEKWRLQEYDGEMYLLT
jgi:integrase